MTQLGIHVTYSGPVFQSGVGQRVMKAVDDGLNDVALKGQALVQAQLVPGHGKRKGHLQRSIHGGLVRSGLAQIDAGLNQQGANVVYTNWIEGVGSRNRPRPGFPGYHMFANAKRQLEGYDVGQHIQNRVMAVLR